MFKKIGPNLKTIVKNSSFTVDNNEIQHFKRFTSEWWDEMGVMRPLHSMNKLRVPLIRDGLISTSSNQQQVDESNPLGGLSLLDVGCGGGILSEALARIGGNITGLDANADLVEEAKCHIKIENFTNVQYVCSSIEDHADKNPDKYDAVIASEVLEHVTKKEEFLAACLKCLKPGGSFFATTVNKTCLANFTGIFLAENVFKILPQGTHEYEKFLKPHRLQRMLDERNCVTLLVHGMLYNPLTNEWSWSNMDYISYAVHAVKS